MTIKYYIGDSDERQWGTYSVIDVLDNAIVKRITVQPKKRISLQTHEHRSEHWTIVQGTAEVTIGHQKVIRKQNESAFIPKGEFHRIENIGEEPLVFIEIQSGELLSEDDIMRYNEDYTPIKTE